MALETLFHDEHWYAFFQKIILNSRTYLEDTDVFFSINFRSGWKILMIMREIHLLHFKVILALGCIAFFEKSVSDGRICTHV